MIGRFPQKTAPVDWPAPESGAILNAPFLCGWSRAAFGRPETQRKLEASVGALANGKHLQQRCT